MRRLDYHPILIVAKEPPANWSAICNRFNDIYLLIGFPTKSTTFKNLNTKDAFSMVLFTLNDPRGKEDTSNLTTNHSSPDADALFMYLKLQQYVPDNVFFFVELRTASNVSVLNATMMRRLREDIGQPPSLLNACKHQDVSPSPPPLFSTSSKYFAATDIKGGMPNSKSKSHAKPSRKENILENKKSERLFWDAMDTHHVLPAFASGKVYVPETFETLLVQSFYNSLTPIICDKLVCGQKGQAVMQAKVPKVVEGWAFLQLYRMFCQFEVVIFGLFRAPSYRNAAPLPYVYICPAMTTIIRGGDCIMVYARNTHLIRALAAAEKLTNLDYAAGDEFSSTT